MRKRWHDPYAGRWLTRDPAGYVDGLSLYLYVRGGPLRFVDPWGLQAWYQGWGTAAAYAVGLGPSGSASSTWRAAGTGAAGGAAHFVNSASFGASDRVGLTNSSAYQGREFAVSRVAGSIAREAAIGAATGGAGNAVSAARAAGTVASKSASALHALGSAYNTTQAAVGVAQGAQMAANGQVAAGLGTAALSALDLKAGGNALTKSQANAVRRSTRGRMIEDGSLAPSQDAHHIVGLSDRRAAPARAKMAEHGVALDHGANGMALERSFHRGTHTNMYYDSVNDALEQAQSLDEVIAALDSINRRLTDQARSCRP